MDETVALLETSTIGRAVAESLPITASLSAAHALGCTLATGERSSRTSGGSASS